MADPLTYLDELRVRLSNPAVLDPELIVYIRMAMRDVNEGQYSQEDYDAQVLDTACHYLLTDNKFPEISSIQSQGVSTTFATNDPERYIRRIRARRQASWMNG